MLILFLKVCGVRSITKVKQTIPNELLMPVDIDVNQSVVKKDIVSFI